MSSVSAANASYYSKLQLTCKTHKSPVEFRNLHASSNWVFGALSRFVSNTLQAELNSKRHILRDSKDFVDRILQLQPNPAHRFCRLDVKHFFMTGTADELSDLSVQFFSNPLKDLLHKVIFFLLDNQHIKDRGKAYKVLKGSGMGLRHSGSMSESVIVRLTPQRALG